MNYGIEKSTPCYHRDNNLNREERSNHLFFPGFMVPEVVILAIGDIRSF